MTNGDDDATFLDTNVLVYANAEEAPFHEVALQAIERLYDEGRSIWISRQIMREYLATLSRPQSFGAAVPLTVLAGDVEKFARRFQIAEDGAEVTSRLLALVRRHRMGGKQIHDANIVATMQAYGIWRLLTHNTADFARFAGLNNVLPQ